MMECERLRQYRYTGTRADTDRLIRWLLDKGVWFEVQLATEYEEEGVAEWEVTCGRSSIETGSRTGRRSAKADVGQGDGKEEDMSGVAGIAYIKAPRRRLIVVSGRFTISPNTVKCDEASLMYTSKWPEVINSVAIELVDGRVWFQRAGAPPIWMC